MRRPLRERDRNRVQPHYKYGSEKVAQFVNYIMRDGKKSTAQRIFDETLSDIKERTKEDPLVVFDTAIQNVGPLMEVRSKRVGGANYQVPYEVRPERRLALALRWIVEAARGKKGASMHIKLADELIAASKNEGDAAKKRENVHRMAEANKAFAHFAWGR